jgi:hypothetical protein
MEMYLLNTDAFYWTLLAVGGLLGFAFGLALSLPAKDAKAGRGGRHRKPGLPKLIKGDGPATVVGLIRAEARLVTA